MPLCRIDYDRSEKREYQNDEDKGHYYLHLVFVPKKLSVLSRCIRGTRVTEYEMNVFPPRTNDNSLDVEAEKELLTLFDNKELGDVVVGRAEVPIPPTIMTYSTDSKNHQAGDVIMSGDSPRIYDTVQIVCEMEMKNGEETPVIPMNQLISRALAMREYRINSGSWYDAADYEGSNDDADDANIINDDPIQQQPPQQQQPQQQRQRPQFTKRQERNRQGSGIYPRFLTFPLQALIHNYSTTSKHQVR